jgi:hypothetical protein
MTKRVESHLIGRELLGPLAVARCLLFNYSPTTRYVSWGKLLGFLGTLIFIHVKEEF